MKATPEQIAQLVMQKDYVAVFMPANGEPYALSNNAIRNLSRDYYYDAQVSGNGVELIVRQGKRKDVEPL